jgi:hypothetical protein
MKKLPAIILSVFCAFSFFAYRQTTESKQNDLPNEEMARVTSEFKPQSARAVAFGVSGKISDIAPAEKKTNVERSIREFSSKESFRQRAENVAPDADNNLANFSDAPMPAPMLSFDGISNKDNNDIYGFAAVPPDTNGDVGPNHFVQSVNILSRVYDKSGSPLTPPFKLSDIFGVLGTPCSQANDGSPITLYDALADRWILSQYCTIAPPFRQMIAVSQTPDPTGAYFVYEFVMPNIKLNDYSKFGVWTDGYYMATDQFIGSEYAGSGVFAFDKRKMLVGDSTAGYIYFDLASTSTVRLGGFLPSDLDGLNAPPGGAPNVFLSYTATEYGNQSDALRLFDFRADFANPNNSTFTERSESPLSVAAFDPTSNEGRNDIAQPPPGDTLDAQSDRLMYRAAYRNFGASESIVVNQTVRVAPLGQTYRAGVRVYELRKAGGAFAVREQSTIGTSDASRWIGSAAQDNQGNIAVGYNHVSETKPPSIFYSGKLASELVGTFRTETALVNGTGVQGGFGSRWGGYSQMTVDPVDDCTFWLTNEYYTAESAAIDPLNWLTRIGKFKFDECAAAPRAAIGGTVTNAANGQPIVGAIVTANAAYIRWSDASGNYGSIALVPNTYTLTATARGYQSQTVTVTIANEQTLTQNFALQPIPLFENPFVNFTAESCGLNNAIDPSETVTVNLGLNNSGAGAATNLVATLLPTGGVVNPSQPQNFGAINSGAATVYRSFTFTASPNLVCGAIIRLTFQLQNAAENLGTVTLEINTGKSRIAFNETFGLTGAPALPVGWTTAASGAQDVWKTSMTRHQTPPLAAYSFAAGQVGVNELISPAIQINSPRAELSFRNWYDLETTFLRNKLYDGSVLEIKIGDAAFQDILAAGGAFTSGGYDGVIESCCQNPLAGRSGWSGKSSVNQTPQFITSTVKIPEQAAGKNIRLRWRVGTDNGAFREGQYIDDVKVSDGYVCACQNNQTNRAPFDFDGDGRTDLSVFRPNDNANEADFYVQNSLDNSNTSAAWGSVGDVPVNIDYDGDGRADYAVYRPSAGVWFILQSSNQIACSFRFGAMGDKLTPADYDGDGRADIAVFRPSDGVWYILPSSGGEARGIRFGASEDLPVHADYDADGKTDVAVFRPSNGVWYALRSHGGLTAVQFGQEGDKPITGDFDGDGSADFVVFRPSNGVWYQFKTTQGIAAVQFGASDDKVLQADFDGDGKRDTAVYRQSTGVWYYRKSTDNTIVARHYGASTDTPLPSVFVP